MDLPINDIIPDLRRAVLSHPATVLHAPPGAGKTTCVPLSLLEDIPEEHGRIVMLEPRRIAAVSAARWMARTIGEDVGGTVGYAIRFDTKRSERTRIEVVTEGILTRRIQEDPGLSGIAIVIFDEFHERSVHADLALAFCLDVQRSLRSDLRLLLMSATMDAGQLSTLLGNAPVVSSSGRSFPVEERFLGGQKESLSLRIAAAVRTALRETNGDILVFLPGAGEIRSAAQELRKTLDLNDERLSLHQLYGDLPFEEQEQAILPSPDRRKVVLATNIAETSLTIQGVHVVIDSGLTRVLRHDPSTGMNRLMTVTVSGASAEQRKGRAGRLGPGVCYRLYSSETYRALVPFSQPEIMVTDLAPLALELAVWGVKDRGQLSWLDVPPASAWEQAVLLLKDLGALDPTGGVTAAGRAMVRLPLHPRLARLMLRAHELGCPRLGADLAALLTERDIFRSGASGRAGVDPDIVERVESLLKARSGREATGADPAALRAAERTATQLMRLLAQRSGTEVSDPLSVGRLLLTAFPDRLCKRREEAGQGFVHQQGRGVQISRNSPLVNSTYIIAVHADLGERSEGYVHLAAPVTEELIRSECAGRIVRSRRVAWNEKEGRVVAAIEEHIGEIVLSSRPVNPDPDEVAALLGDAVRASPALLRFSREMRQFQSRVRLMRTAFPEEHWPDLEDNTLLTHPEAWLLPWLNGIRSAADLARIDLLPALKARLNGDQQRKLDRRAPVKIAVPSGSNIALDYTAGELPVLAVKLQEMFGLADTPAIADGRMKVLLHLLSPARQPVQVTQDLQGFWNNVYPEVKKDLKGRYPRHPWPDDPWNAVPTRRTKQRK